MQRRHLRINASITTILGTVVWLTTSSGLVSAQTDEFQVNQVTTGSQLAPTATITTEGGFLVIWQSQVSPGDDENLAVVARRLDAAASPVGDDFQVNLSTAYSQRRPKISRRVDGSFVVVWETFYPGGKGPLTALQARTFDAAGQGAPTDFLLTVSPNIYTTINSHDVGAAANDEFVVSYSRFYYYDGVYSASLRTRRFQSDGTLIDSGTMISENGREIRTRMAGDDASGFVVASQSREYFGQYSEARVQRLDSSGVAVGSLVDVHGDNPFGFGSGTEADAEFTESGDLVVVWNGYDVYNGLQTQIYGRRVSSAGVPDPGGPQVINLSSGVHQAPRLARGAEGRFLVVWENFNAPGDDGLGLRGRRLASDGSPFGEEFAVNAYTTGLQRSAEVVASADGRSFLVVWNSAVNVGDTDAESIRGRRFFPWSIFEDGFESGTSAAWSAVVPEP